MSQQPIADGACVSIENEKLELSLRRDTGEYRIVHKPTGKVWSGPQGRLCSMTLRPNDARPKSGYDRDSATLRVNQLADVICQDQKLTAVYVPDNISTARTEHRIEFALTLVGPSEVELSYRVVQDDPAWLIHSVDMIDDALAISSAGDYAILPVYQGEIIAVGKLFSYLPGDRDAVMRTSEVLGTYPGGGQWNMAMFALVQGDSTALITWDNPDIEPGICGREVAAATDRPQQVNVVDDTIAPGASDVGGRQITATVRFYRRASSLRIRFLQDAGYAAMADEYRKIGKQRGFFVSLKDKIARTPEIKKNIGALRFTVSPMWGRSEVGGWLTTIPKGTTRCDYTFAQAADVAEHLKHDLGIDKGELLVNGWTRRGYDMDYPDVFPAAEACGGDEGLAEASRRVQALQWQFGLLDNAFILFKDCPSTDPADALVRQDGTVLEGGIGVPRWRLYYCSPARMIKNVKKRFPKYKQLYGVNLMYSDCISGTPLPEDFSDEHPLTRQQAIETYRQLIEYKRSQVPVLTSELMDEWSVSMFDAMGAYMGQAHDYARAIPLFEMVYGECCNLESWPWGSLLANTIVNCIAMGRMPYLTFPPADYLQNGIHVESEPNVYNPAGGRLRWDCWWLQGYHEDNPFLRGDDGWGRDINWYDRFVKNVYEVTSPLNELTATQRMTDHELLADDRQVERVDFANGVSIVTNRSDSDFDYQGTLLGPLGFLATGPQFIAFYAKRYQGVDYADGALFTVRSNDGRAINQSSSVRIYHGFGKPDIHVGGKLFTVQREETVSLA